MGLNVMSSLSGLAAAAPAIPGTQPTEGLPGDFAALLSGELKSLLAELTTGLPSSASDLSLGKTLGKLDKSLEIADQASTEQTGGVIDPALIASLMGNPALTPEITRQATPTLPAPNENAEAGIARAMQAIAESRSGQTGLERDTLKGKSSTATDALEKPALTGKAETSTGLLEKAARSEPAPTPAFDATLADAVEANKAPALASATAPTTLTLGASQGNDAAKIAVEENAGGSNPVAMANMSNVATGKLATEHAVPPQANVDTHIHEPSWPQQFGEKIVWLARNDQQSAHININPPQLGPIQISLNLSGDQASVTFASPHPEVRQAIESAMPQLKEMLSTAGINLGQSNVGANMGQQNPENPFQSANGKHMASENAILPANEKAASTGNIPPLHRGRGLVDLFA